MDVGTRRGWVRAQEWVASGAAVAARMTREENRTAFHAWEPAPAGASAALPVRSASYCWHQSWPVPASGRGDAQHLNVSVRRETLRLATSPQCAAVQAPSSGGCRSSRGKHQRSVVAEPRQRHHLRTVVHMRRLHALPVAASHAAGGSGSASDVGASPQPRARPSLGAEVGTPAAAPNAAAAKLI